MSSAEISAAKYYSLVDNGDLPTMTQVLGCLKHTPRTVKHGQAGLRALWADYCSTHVYNSPNQYCPDALFQVVKAGNMSIIGPVVYSYDVPVARATRDWMMTTSNPDYLTPTTKKQMTRFGVYSMGTQETQHISVPKLGTYFAVENIEHLLYLGNLHLNNATNMRLKLGPRVTHLRLWMLRAKQALALSDHREAMGYSTRPPPVTYGEQLRRQAWLLERIDPQANPLRATTQEPADLSALLNKNLIPLLAVAALEGI